MTRANKRRHARSPGIEETERPKKPKTPIRPVSKSSSFAKLPLELEERILADLDALDILNAELVCRAWRDLVRSSLQLQYKLECSVHDVCDANAPRRTTLFERIARVRRWKQSWKALQWSAKYVDALPCADLGSPGREFQMQGSVIGCFSPGSGNTFEFYRMSSRIRTVEPRQWTIAGLLDHTSYGAWAFDPEENLLAVLQICATTETVEVCFYSCTTPGHHPEAGAPTLRIALPAHALLDDTWQLDLSICGSIVIVYAESPDGSHISIWFYNWRQGEVLSRVVCDAGRDAFVLDHVAFLSQDTVLFTAMDQEANYLVAVELRDLPRRICRFPDVLFLEHCVVLEYPEPNAGVDYERSTIVGSPMHTRGCAEGAFGMKYTNTIISIILSISDAQEDPQSYDFVITSRFIVSSLANLPSRVPGEYCDIVPWKDWCEHTRLFRATSVPEMQACGSRYLTAQDLDDGTHRLVVRDFDTVLALKLDAAAGDADLHMDCEPHENTDGFWKRPEATGAPYREVVSEIIVEADDRVLLAEDGIFVARARDNLPGSDSTKLEIYEI